MYSAWGFPVQEFALTCKDLHFRHRYITINLEDHLEIKAQPPLDDAAVIWF